MDKEIYKIVINDLAEGVYGVSLVDDPANETEFIMLSKSQKKITLSTNEEKRLLTGVVLIPNQKILRKDENTGEEYYIVFEEKEIRELSENFFKNSNHKNSTINHITSQKVNGLTYVESWIVEDPMNDKSNALGFSGLPKGTWIMSAKIDNDEIWEKAKNGEIKGFSIDSILMMEKIEMNKNNKIIKKEKMSVFKKIVKMLSQIKLASVETDAGVITADSFELGEVVFLNDLVYADATFEYEGNTISTDVDGVIVSIEALETIELEDEVTIEEEIADELVDVVIEEADAIIEDAPEEVNYEEVIQTLTDELAVIVAENTELKAKLTKLSKQPASTKLKANEIKLNRGKETTLQAIARIANTK